jgi:hypothetical protein
MSEATSSNKVIFTFLKTYDIDVAYTVIFNQVRLVVLIIIGVTLRKFLVFVSK